MECEPDEPSLVPTHEELGYEDPDVVNVPYDITQEFVSVASKDYTTDDMDSVDDVEEHDSYCACRQVPNLEELEYQYPDTAELLQECSRPPSDNQCCHGNSLPKTLGDSSSEIMARRKRGLLEKRDLHPMDRSHTALGPPQA